MGERPDGLTLDRIDSNGNYEKGNCRWATRETQQNNMRNNHFVIIEGTRKTVSQWARHFGVVYPKIASNRLRLGWDPLKAFTTPKK